MEVVERTTQQKNVLVSDDDLADISEYGNISAEKVVADMVLPIQEAFDPFKEQDSVVAHSDVAHSVQKEPDPLAVKGAEPFLEPENPVPVPVPVHSRKRSPKKKLVSSPEFSPDKRVRNEEETTPTTEVFRYSLWTISEIRAEFNKNDITSTEQINLCIKLFAILACSSYGDNPSEFLSTGYTVHTLLSHLHQDCVENNDHVSLVSYISKEEAFVVLIQNSLRLYDYLTTKKARILASFALKGSHIDEAELAEDARLDAIGLEKYNEREQVRAAERKAIRLAARPFPESPLSDTEIAIEAQILAQEAELFRAEHNALLADYQHYNELELLLPDPDTIRPMVEWAFQKRRGPKDLNLQDIITISSVIKSIMVLESNHRLKITNVRLIFSSVRYARLAKLQLSHAILFLPSYRKILFVCQLNTKAALSYHFYNWTTFQFSLQDEIFTPKYDGRHYLCMRGDSPPKPP